MTDDLKKRIAELEQANQALVEAHGKLSIAYLGRRVNEIEDSLKAARKAFVDLEKRIRKLEKDE